MTERWEHTRLDHRSRQAAAIAAAALSLLTEQGAAGLSMAAIADATDVSRQTLYRYYPDVDAVLVGIAELVTSHDEAFAQLVLDQSDPLARLDLIAGATAAADHDHPDIGELFAVLPPAGRDILARHRERTCALLRDVLQQGIDDGTFAPAVDPTADAPLILGLLAAADPRGPERALALVHQLIEPPTEESVS